MPYLYLASSLLAWVALAFVYRFSERRNGERFCMGGGMGLGSLACNGLLMWFTAVPLGQSVLSAWVIGLLVGSLNVMMLPLFLAAVARADISICWTTVSLSFAFASALGLIFPGERPALVALLGLSLAALAILCLGLDVWKRRAANPAAIKRGWFLFMALSFTLNALVVYGFTLVACVSGPGAANNSAFLLASAGVLAGGSLVLALARRSAASAGSGLLAGLAGGTFSFIGCYFTMLALNADIPGSVVYPATLGGSNIVVALIALLFLRERPGRWGYLGIAGGTLALVLLGMGAK